MLVANKIAQITAERVHGKQVVLVIPSNGDASQIRRLIGQVRETLQARVLEIVSCREETVITIKLQKRLPPVNLTDELTKMDEVREVETKLTQSQAKCQGKGS